MTDDVLAHIGILRRSGRYPWGSGETANQRNKEFLDYVADLKKKGLSDTEIVNGLNASDAEINMTTTQLRAAKTIAKNAQWNASASQALRLKQSGMSNMAIGREMGINESSVRAFLNPAAQQRNNELMAVSQYLKEQVAEKTYLDIGLGTENWIGVSQPKLATAIAILEDEGYIVQYAKVQQVGTGKFTRIKALTPPETPYGEFAKNVSKIRSVAGYSEDGGLTFLGIEPPVSVNSKRIGVRYAEEGGANKDGVIELRRNVEDLSLGQSRYAQVRIAVDDTHYLKGMAMYSDNMPDGVDLLFNTNKSGKGATSNLSAMKDMKDDVDNPFGSIVRQKHYVDKKGVERLSPLNIVGTNDPSGIKTPGEEGGWYNWSRNLSSQMLSKQSPTLAKAQLGISYDLKKAEFDEINSLTNPAVKKKLLKEFAESADSSAVHLQAAGLPRTRNHVILPINSLKDTEIYAPNFRSGEKVVLIRHPHGGIFEIPELTVNNRNKEAISVLQNAKDAVGINARVAARLSGADFDGDTVLVIPNAQSGPRRVKNSSPLSQLKDFDPKTMYPAYEGMKKMGEKGGGNKQTEMGNISNLITDMTIKGASHAEIARAVKHSMVVIDAEKHNLNYKLSAVDNGIKALKTKYQGRSNGGADTLISQASSEIRINARKPRSAAKGGPIDPATGRKMYEETGASYVRKTVSKRTGLPKETTIYTKDTSTKMAETHDAFTLASAAKTPMEAVYATHANKLKALANEARKAAYVTPNAAYNASAKTVYQKQVDTLNAKLNVALKNKPQERSAQLLANAVVSAKRDAKPGMDNDELKKLRGGALVAARTRTGAKKQQIEITPIEWEAIQAGAITDHKLGVILDNSNTDTIKKYATPRTATVMIPAKVARAKAMLAAGYPQSEVADALGVPVSTLNSSISGG